MIVPIELEVRLGGRKEPSTLNAAPARPAAQPQPDGSGWDYDLKVDEQTEHFLAAKQQLTYFIVTAAVAPIAFVTTLLKDKGTEIEAWSLSLLLAGGLVGLLAAGAALFSLHYEHRSHRRHIGLRYRRIAFLTAAFLSLFILGVAKQ